jgi:CBS domain-containing protein
MAGEEKPAENKEGGRRSRRKKQPPLQPDSPLDEGAPGTAKPESPPPAAKAPAGRAEKPSARAAGRKELRVADVMTEDPVCCVPETPLVNVARLMAENSCGAIPVIRSAADRTPVGIVTDRDVAVRTVAEGRNPLELAAGHVMTPSPITIGLDEPLAACASLMREKQVRRIVVVDPQGRVRGLVVLAQVARHLPREISGETVKDISQPPQGGAK